MNVIGVLMVCMGNICRSPAAHGIFAKHVYDAGLAMRIRVDSAGTYAGMRGDPPDKRSQRVAQARGYDLSPLRSRPVVSDDFTRFNYIVVMDDQNLADTKRKAAEVGFNGKLVKLLDFSPDPAMKGKDVPDPYYGGLPGFETMIGLIEPACEGLLQHIIATDFARARQT